MELDLDLLKKCPLFADIKGDDIVNMLGQNGCLNAVQKNYEKDSYIFAAGEKVSGVGILASGSAEIIRETASGVRSVTAALAPPDMFGETFICAGISESPVSVYTAQGAKALFIDYARIVTTCGRTCGFHTQLIRNMLFILAKKNLVLNGKIGYLEIRGLRARIASYLLDMAAVSDKAVFQIPFDRAGLAGFLGADRSALSRELARMKDEGLIDYHKNSFKLISYDKLKEVCV